MSGFEFSLKLEHVFSRNSQRQMISFDISIEINKRDINKRIHSSDVSSTQPSLFNGSKISLTKLTKHSKRLLVCVPFNDYRHISLSVIKALLIGITSFTWDTKNLLRQLETNRPHQGSLKQHRNKRNEHSFSLLP